MKRGNPSRCPFLAWQVAHHGRHHRRRLPGGRARRMMCLGDLETAVREDLPLLVVVYIKKDMDLDALFVS
jgi:hypothetical protein